VRRLLTSVGRNVVTTAPLNTLVGAALTLDIQPWRTYVEDTGILERFNHHSEGRPAASTPKTY